LRSRVHDQLGRNILDRLFDASPVPYIHFVMTEIADRFLEAALVPTRVPLRAKENRPLIVVDTGYFKPSRREVQADL
jgi:hypothetical protein